MEPHKPVARPSLYDAQLLNAIGPRETNLATGTFNVGTGVCYSAQHMVDTISEIMAWDLVVHSVAERQRTGDAPYLLADNTKLVELGWKCEKNFSDALHKTLSHYHVI